MLSVNLSARNAGNIRDLKREFTAVITRYYISSNRDHSKGNHLLTGYREDGHKMGLDHTFKRLSTRRGKNEHWHDKVYAIYQTAKNIVSSDIARPNTAGYDAQSWNTALDHEKIRLIKNIFQLKNGCKDGTSWKIELMFDRYKNKMDMQMPGIRIARAMAKIVYDWKIENLNKVGAESRGAEGKLYQPLLLKQRMRLPLSLAGDYQRVDHIRFAQSTDAKNHPVQMMRNLFEENQPQRGRGQRRQSFTPLNVIRLVDRVLTQMNRDGSIREEDVNQIINGDRTLTLDREIMAVKCERGVLFKYQASPYKTKEMALFLLEKFGYVIISDEVKDTFYKGRRPHLQSNEIDYNGVVLQSSNQISVNGYAKLRHLMVG